MKIKSPAGEFHVTFHTMQLKNGRVMLGWRLGVWEAKGFIEKKDIIWIFKNLLKSPVLIWTLVKTLFGKDVPVSFEDNQNLPG